jgi:hypothetical protein
MFSSEIERAIASNPWVKSASLNSCEEDWFSCYNIKLVERSARYKVQVGKATWLVDDSGNFLSTVRQEQVEEEIVAGSRPLIEVASISEEQGSPDIARARLLHLSKVVDYLEREISLDISGVKYMTGGDLIVHFSQDNFDAVFSSEVADPAVLRSEVSRLKKVLQEFEGKESALSSVDLAFDRSVVVRTKSG